MIRLSHASIEMSYLSAICILLICSSPLNLAQQPYAGKETTSCHSTGNSVLGYTCNGAHRRCQTYLTFRSRPPLNAVSSISTLLAVNKSEIAKINSVSENAIFETDRVVLVPVTCSCSGQHYQTNASYVIVSGDTYFSIANNTFQGLSTCQALIAQNSIGERDLKIRDRITVPIRCACPTTNQTDVGVNYLLSYLITWGQSVDSISGQFGVPTDSTLAANGLSETNSLIFPFTTLLVPLRDPPTGTNATVHPPPPPPPSTELVPTPPGDGTGKTWIYVVIGVGVGGVIAIAAAVWAFLFFYRRPKKMEGAKAAADEPSQNFDFVEKPLIKKEFSEDSCSRDLLDSLSSIAQSLEVYSFDELRRATHDFSSDCLIEGSVYRGTINGDFAAIKKLNGDLSGEINLLKKINHFNLIRLSGFSFNEGHWYLVYEYAANGPLKDWIHGTNEERSLSWNTRLHIALDVAAGLNYLHHYSSPPYIHKDLNSSNVLLDQNFRAKITNFSLTRSVDVKEGEFALTRHIVGTQGYMSPEYLENGLVSPKLDVYAFGVLLLEILTGKGVSQLSQGGNFHLSDVITPVLSEEEGLESLRNLMDPCLQGNYPPDLALVLFKMIHSCIKRDPSDRPSMIDISQTISRIFFSTLSSDSAISISQHGR